MNQIYIILSIAFFFLYSIDGFTQQISDKENEGVKTFIKNIDVLGDSRGVTVEEINNGGYILTGYIIGGENRQEDLFILKTNSSGETLWAKTFGDKGSDHGWAVRQTDDGGYIIVGYTNSFGNGGMDIYLIRVDSDGKEIWTKTYGGKGDEFGWDVRITKDNGYIIAAQTDSYGNGEIDAYLIKVDENGNEEWSKTYGGDKIDRIFSVQQSAEGGYIAAGITYSYESINDNDRDGYLLKTDSSGNKEWHKIIGGDAYDVAHSIALTNDGGFFATGYGESIAKSGSRDVYLIKTNSIGETELLKSYGGSNEERGIKGYQTKDGGYIMVGFTSENRNLYLVRTDISGNTLWTRTYGSTEMMDFGYTVRETIDGGFILTGHSQDLNSGKNSILLIKTDSKGLVNQNE